MATLSALRDGLKTRLATIADLHPHDIMPDTIIPPAAIVRPVSGDYRRSLSARASTRFEILLIIQLSRLSTAQDGLDPYLSEAGTKSIFAALEGDSTLGGIADDLRVDGWQNYGSIAIAGAEYLSAIIPVEVYHD